MKVRSTRIVVMTAAVAGLGAATAVPASAELVEAPMVPIEQAVGEAVPGQYIVTLEPGVSARTPLRTLGIDAQHTFTSVLDGFSAKLSKAELEELRQHPDVAAVEEDQVTTLDATQDSPPWGLDRVDQRDLPLSDSYTYNETAGSVHAYVIDTGIDASHPDFEGRADQAYNAVDAVLGDCHGHGTHVAGTIGSATYGVAKQAQLHGVKVLNCAGAGTNADVIEGIDWVAQNHQAPAVANMSLGGGKSDALNTATNNLADSGVFVSVAAGNEDQDACDVSPASATEVTAVMASDRSDKKASFSNYGNCAHLYAPGVQVESTFLLGGTETFSGTSMAAPHVAGVAALYKAASGDASSDTVRNWLVNNATSGAIEGNPGNTPNRLLHTNGL